MVQNFVSMQEQLVALTLLLSPAVLVTVGRWNSSYGGQWYSYKYSHSSSKTLMIEKHHTIPFFSNLPLCNEEEERRRENIGGGKKKKKKLEEKQAPRKVSKTQFL